MATGVTTAGTRRDVPRWRLHHRLRRRSGLALRPWLREAAVVFAACLLLFVQIVDTVYGTPLFEDEAVAGLVAARPLPEVLATVVVDRGGAPLHFVLAHVALQVDPSPFALRWLSLLFALATVAVTYALGRALGGRVAAAVAAAVAASSALLLEYGTFGRMYTLFAFASALSLLLFVRAVERPTRGRIALAVAGAWLLAASHPYGLVVAGLQALFALVLGWRRARGHAALAVVLTVAALSPFVWAGFRLAERFRVGVDGRENLAGPAEGGELLTNALAAFAGGSGVFFAAFLGLGVAGLALLFRARPALGAFALALLLAIPALLVLLGTSDPEGLTGFSPRHLTFALPLWAALIGLATARVVATRGPLAAAGVAAAVTLAAVVAPTGGIQDPRTNPHYVELGAGTGADAVGGPAALATPSDWIRERAHERAVLFPFSAVFLGSLPEAARALTLPRGQPELLARSLERAEYPVRTVMVAVPLGDSRVAGGRLRRALGDRFEVGAFERWLVVSADGSFADPGAVLDAIHHVFLNVAPLLDAPADAGVRGYVAYGARVSCGAIAEAVAAGRARVAKLRARECAGAG